MRRPEGFKPGADYLNNRVNGILSGRLVRPHFSYMSWLQIGIGEDGREPWTT